MYLTLQKTAYKPVPSNITQYTLIAVNQPNLKKRACSVVKKKSEKPAADIMYCLQFACTVRTLSGKFSITGKKGPAWLLS